MKRIGVVMGVVVLLGSAHQARASNGLNLIGFGTESMAMAGADLAVARDTSAMNTNPAGLAQIAGHRLDLYGATAYAVNIRHADGFGNDRRNARPFIHIGDLGYAQRLASLPMTVGVGIFAQGGAGVLYEDLATAFGTTDDLSVQFRIARLTPAVAWSVTDALSVGLSAVLTYADLNQEVFPNTSAVDPAAPAPFFGFDLKEMDTVAAGIKVGAMFRPHPRLTLGAGYTSQVDLDLDGGELVSDQTAEGRGKVTYRDVEASGINQPQEAGIGLAFQATDALLVACEVTWIDWSRAVNRSAIVARDPDDPTAPAILPQYTDHNWRDQYVFAIGLAYDLTPATTLRAGYNRARNPIPDRSLNPLLAQTGRHHLTAGADHRLTDRWRLAAAVEYQINEKNTYTNSQLPFGPDAREESEYLALHLMASRVW